MIRPRSFLRVLAWAMVLVLAYLTVTFVQVWSTAGRDQAQPADAIIVLGAAQYSGSPSPVFAARLDHAVQLYTEGLADVVVVTGGRQPGDQQSEANAGDTYLQAQGIPASALRLEVDGTTSYESLAAIARFLAEEGRREVVLVSDGWHLRRSAEIATSVGLQAWTSPAANSRYSLTSALPLMLRETVGLAVGRVIGFRRLDRLAEASLPFVQ